MTGYIYKIETTDGKIYIGQSKNEKTLKSRWHCHEKKWPGSHKEIIITAPHEDLDELEILMIATFDSHRNGLNKTLGGSGIKVRFPDAETNRKKSEALTGKKRAHLSEEHKQSISKANKGKRKSYRTEEHKRKIGEASKGKSPSEETRQKLREAANRQWRRQWAEK